MCDHGRLNFHYVQNENRLRQPLARQADGTRKPVGMRRAIDEAAGQLLRFKPEEIAVIASARLTNEELYLAGKLIRTLGVSMFDVVTRPQKADGILVSADGNPNTAGARLMKVASDDPGRYIPIIARKANDGGLKALICLGEDASACGVHPEVLDKLPCVIALDLLPNATTHAATVLLPGSAFTEKRGSMINVNGRLQRLNRAAEIPRGRGRRLGDPARSHRRARRRQRHLHDRRTLQAGGRGNSRAGRPLPRQDRRSRDRPARKALHLA